MPSEVFGVRPAYVGDDADTRFGDGCQGADLARVIHAQFEDGDAAIVRQTQDRERDAEVVVEIADGVAGAELRRDQGGDDVFGGGLAGAAGYADHGSGPSFARPARPSFASAASGVRHLQLQAWCFRQLLDDGDLCASFECLGHVIVAVVWWLRAGRSNSRLDSGCGSRCSSRRRWHRRSGRGAPIISAMPIRERVMSAPRRGQCRGQIGNLPHQECVRYTSFLRKPKPRRISRATSRSSK